MKGGVRCLGLGAALLFALSTPVYGERAQDHFQRGLELGKKGKVDEAIVQFERAVQIDPNRSSLHYNLGNAYFMKRRFEEARESYRRAIRLERKNVDAHFNLGIVCGILGDLEEAVRSFHEVLRHNPKDGETHYLLTRAYFFKKDYSTAWRHHQEAKRLGWNVPADLTRALEVQIGKRKDRGK